MSRGSQQQQQPVDDDILNPKVSASALDFLLIELVPITQRITEQLHAREQALIDEYKRSRIFNRTASKTPRRSTDDDGGQAAAEHEAKNDATDSGSAGVDAGEAVTSLGFPPMEESTREGVQFRLEGMGYRVGQGLVER